MKTIIISIISFLFLISSSYAQKADVLYLKNGSIIYGELVDITSDTYRIKISDGSIFVYDRTEVEKFQKEEPENQTDRKEGFGIGVEAGFLIGPQSTEYVAPFSFSILGTYNFDTRHAAAIGTGVEFLGVSYTPVFAEYKVHLLQGSTSPFIFGRAGALLYLGNNEDTSSGGYYQEYKYMGGPSFTLGTGITWKKRNHQTVLSFAYRYAKTKYTYDDTYTSETTYESNYKRLEIKVGFFF